MPQQWTGEARTPLPAGAGIMAEYDTGYGRNGTRGLLNLFSNLVSCQTSPGIFQAKALQNMLFLALVV
jgi:hypothetical protein